MTVPRMTPNDKMTFQLFLIALPGPVIYRIVWVHQEWLRVTNWPNMACIPSRINEKWPC